MEIRFFAGAAEAAGATSVVVDVAPDRRIAEVVESLADGNERLARVLAVCSLLLDGVRVADRGDAVGSAAQLDVLPPFAGG